jgi:hypothetical protein
MPGATPKGSTRPARKASGARATLPSVNNGGHGYVVPLLHVRFPDSVVDGGFWVALAGATLVGSIDPPLAALIGAGVLVARHHNRR